MQRRGRGHLARLDDARAAGGERERQLLRDDQQREIPRRDDRDDADRLAQDDSRGGRGRASRSCRRADRGRARRRSARCRRRLRFRERAWAIGLPLLQRIEQARALAVAVDEIGGLQQHARALRALVMSASGPRRTPCARRRWRARRRAAPPRGTRVTSAPCAGLSRSIVSPSPANSRPSIHIGAVARKARQRRREPVAVEEDRRRQRSWLDNSSN